MSASALLSNLIMLLVSLTMMFGLIGSWSWLFRRIREGETLVPRLCKSTRVPWGAGSVVLVLLSWLVVNLGVVLIYALVTRGSLPALANANDKAGPDTARTLGFTEQMVIVSLINVILLVTVPVLLRLTSGARLADLGLEVKCRGLSPHLGVGAIAFFVIAPFVYALNGLAVLIWRPEKHLLEKMVRNESSMGIAELAVLSAVLLAPMTEELIFRGVIQRWLVRLFNPDDELALTPQVVASSAETILTAELPHAEPDHPVASDPEVGVGANPYLPPSSSIGDETRTGSRRSLTRPIVLTSLLFAAVHFPQWPAPLGIFVLSLGLGYIAEQTGSLISAMVMHALFNGLGTFLLLVMVHFGGLASQAEGEKAKPAPIPPLPPAGYVAPDLSTTWRFRITR